MGTRIRPPGAIIGQIAMLVAALALGLVLATPVRAQGLIRDAEIEATLTRIATPLFKAAGVNPSHIEVLVVNDGSLNAFVMDGRAIFVHSGLIMRLETIDMLQSVIGHEIAHITSGHLVQRTLNLRTASNAARIGLLLSLAVGAAGNPELGTGLAAGTAASALRTFLSHTRAEETTADQIGTQYMIRAGSDPSAALEVMELFRGQEALQPGRQDPYTRTHPLSHDRMRALKAQIVAYGSNPGRQPDELVYWHGRMVAKFVGFMGNPSYVLRHIERSDRSEQATMLRAIAYHRQGNVKKATSYMDQLLSMRPNDAYYHELKGQILLEGRQAAAAIASYRKAVELAPKEALILAGYGRSLLALDNPDGDRKALEVLKKAYAKDSRDTQMLRDLAIAWAKSGNNGMASLVTAERYAFIGRFRDAQTNAQRAEGLLPQGSTGWLKAQDILATAKEALKK